MKLALVSLIAVGVLGVDAAGQARARADVGAGRVLRVRKDAAPLARFDFFELDEAVAAARDGDVILVGAGNYGRLDLRAGKSLFLMRDGPGEVRLSFLWIEGVAADEHVVLRGFTSGDVRVEEVEGNLWFEDCTMRELDLTDCRNVVVTKSSVLAGIEARQVAGLFVYDSTLVGERGVQGYTNCYDYVYGTRGRPGLDLVDSFAFLSGCYARGGQGGTSGQGGSITCCAQAGDGGYGIEVHAGSSGIAIGTTFEGGLAGVDVCYFGGGGSEDGFPILLEGDLATPPLPARHYGAGPLARLTGAMTLTFEAFAGDGPSVRWSDRPALGFVLAFERPIVLPGDAPALFFDRLTTPRAELVRPPFPAGGLRARALFTQAFFDAPGPSGLERVPGPPSAIVVLDEPCFGVPVLSDCNGNGLDDACEAATGLSPDADRDGRPDECATAFQASSGPLPVAGGVPIEFVVPPGPRPSGPVRVRVAVHDVSADDAFDVALNAIPLRPLFADAALVCGVPAAATFGFAPGIYTAIVGDGPGVLTVTPPPLVSCGDATVTIEIAYPGAELDANGNFVEDALELTPLNDCDGDGILDVVQLRRSAAGATTPFQLLPSALRRPPGSRPVGERRHRPHGRRERHRLP